LNEPGWLLAARKYVEANRIRKYATAVASASIPRSRGYGALAIARACQATSTTRTINPTKKPRTVRPPQCEASGSR
jgi:hypothetical protein